MAGYHEFAFGGTMRIINLGLLGAFIAMPVHAADTVPHQLIVHLPDGARWQQNFVTHQNGFPAASDVPLPITLRLKASFSYVLKVRDDGFSISRRTLNYDEATPLDTDFADLSKIRHGQAVIVNDLDYGTDANLKPQTVYNWPEIKSRSRALFVATLGEDMAAMADEEEAANPDLKDTPQRLLVETLMPENLMAELYLQPHVAGVAITRRDVVMSSLTGEDLPADITVTLDVWDEAAGRADYSLSVGPVAEAKTNAVAHYLGDLLYPLHTMDAGEPEQLRQQIAELTSQSIYDDRLTCRFSASIATGLVTSGDCRREMQFAMPQNSENVDVTFNLTQSLLP